MAGVLLDGRDQRQQMRFFPIRIQREHVGHVQQAAGQGAGFVEHEGVGLGQAVNRRTAAKQKAVLGALVHVSPLPVLPEC